MDNLMCAAERYVSWRRVGSGAHGVVYRVFDNELQCEVAIKLLNEQASLNRTLVEGLGREVLISRQLRHPNICPIHDLYDGSRGIGIVMDFIEGSELGNWLKGNKGHTLETAPQRLSLLISLTEALVIAHTRIVHRDLKPSNIFLVGGSVLNPVIMDFGISIIGHSGDDEICGTPKYMAPEQFLAAETVDPRSDLFALGIMAYEIFTDRVPPNSLRNVLKTRQPPCLSLEDIPPPSTYCPVIPPILDRLILQLTSYSQGDRPASAAEVLKVLRSVALGSPDVHPGAGAMLKRERVPIPAAADHLGSPPASRNANEKPQRRVHLSSYLIDVFPVTNRDYKTFVQHTGRPPAPLSDDPAFGLDDHPVVGITFDEAAIFAKWAGGKLPSEARWEHAARGGIKFAEYPWGNQPPTPTQANINGIWKATSPVNTHPLGCNPFGLWDMCGNTWEWCADFFDPSFYQHLRNDCADPVNDKHSAERSIRGGSFQTFTSMGRCAFRGHADPLDRRSDIGFRLVYDG